VYFKPERFEVGRGEVGAFVDGGVSMANNPALLLFLAATLRGYPFRWATGERHLLLVSVGTGFWRRRDTVGKVLDAKFWQWGVEAPSMLMEDATWQNQLLLQAFSHSATAVEINREVGDLSEDLLTPEPLLTYLRYNAQLDELGLNALGLAELAPRLASLREMSAAENRTDLARIGERAAAQQVTDAHFSGAFDLAR
jgi:hypothetical protein